MNIPEKMPSLEADTEKKIIIVKEIIVILIFASVIVLTVVAVKLNGVSSAVIKQPENKGFERVIATRIIDGDTFETSSGDRVRLICIDAPEIKNNELDNASLYLSNLIINKTIFLERDKSDKDEYGRLLRYVYVQDLSNQESYLFVNKDLVDNGYAKVVRYGIDIKYCDLIEGV